MKSEQASIKYGYQHFKAKDHTPSDLSCYEAWNRPIVLAFQKP